MERHELPAADYATLESLDQKLEQWCNDYPTWPNNSGYVDLTEEEASLCQKYRPDDRSRWLGLESSTYRTSMPGVSAKLLFTV